MKPTFWPLGKVVSVNPGADGLVRKAVVCVNGKDYVRPITSIIKLPVENSLEECLPSGTVSAVVQPYKNSEEANAAVQPDVYRDWRHVFE